MSSVDKVIQLLNSDNPHLPYPLSLTNVSLDPPIAAPVGAGRNSSVVVHGVPGHGYVDQVEVFYDRIPLDALFSRVSPAVRSTDSNVTPAILVDRINATYGLNLTVDDLNPPTIPTFQSLEETHPIDIAVRDDSFGWMGTVSVATTYGHPLLESVVIIHLLPLLTHPVDFANLGNRKAGYLCTYNFDFTAYKAELQIDPATGMWANFNRVQEIGKLAGLTWWYNRWVQDLPTSSVPDANPNFERVMVQSYVYGSVMGPLYFHYDQNW